MSLNATPNAERLHIALFGRRNAGKSSLINALTGQNLAIVSDVAGTTTDPVYKNMELLPIGPVTLIDTAGLDDEGSLGKMRVEKTYGVLAKTDLALVCIDTGKGIGKVEEDLIEEINRRKIPFILVKNKSDLGGEISDKENEISVSAKTGENITALKELVGNFCKKDSEKRLVGDIVNKGDRVVLVIPIDSAAPKGRLILPQQQTIRDILDSGGYAIAVRDTELEEFLAKYGNPDLVITDSQVFSRVSKIVPEEVPMTSFSILFSRYKGELWEMADAAKKVFDLNDGDKVLIAEGCTHHRQCEDIGTVKIPKWISEKTGKKIDFEFVSGGDFPKDLEKYSLIIHCGGCTLNEAEVKSRIALAKEQNVPITNYGTMIAYLNGILERSTRPLRKD